jgi:hypothetical protein
MTKFISCLDGGNLRTFGSKNSHSSCKLFFASLRIVATTVANSNFLLLVKICYLFCAYLKNVENRLLLLFYLLIYCHTISYSMPLLFKSEDNFIVQNIKMLLKIILIKFYFFNRLFKLLHLKQGVLHCR